MHYLEIIVRPIAALILFGGAAVLAWWVGRFIPAGKLKTLLYKREEITDPKSNAFWYLLVAMAVQFGIIYLMAPDLF